MRLRIATRGSKLSLIQAQIVMDMIRKIEPDVKFELVIVKTTGDIIQDKPLYEIGVKGIFEKEVNRALLRGEADIAVHSLKDLPSEISPGLVLAGFPPRDPPYDALVTVGKCMRIEDLPSGTVVGTSSVRRRAFLMGLRPDLKVEVIRGNVDTRVRKLCQGLYDAIILAEAGLIRMWDELKKYGICYTRLPINAIPPPPGQGIIVAVVRETDAHLVDLLRKASDRKAMIEAIAERAFLRRIGGGCHVPLGGVAFVEDDKVRFLAAIASQDGSRRIFVEVEGNASNPELVGVKAAEALLEKWDGNKV